MSILDLHHINLISSKRAEGNLAGPIRFRQKRMFIETRCSLDEEKIAWHFGLEKLAFN